ncbi:MAG: ABC transporter substrate-binding protein, partial [Oscillibacter sp.]
IYYFNKFTEETGITVNYIRLSAGEMLTRVAAEKENPQAALMFGGSTDNYIAAADQGLLEPYQSPELSATPEAYIDPNGNWNPIYVGAIAFACNKDWFAEKGYAYPTSWQDLLDPKYKGEIIMAHPATSGTAYTVLATLVQLMGDDAVWDYLSKLNVNMTQYTKSGSAAPNAVALGEAAIALTFSHDGLQPTTEGYPIELSFPSEGTGYEVGAAALIKGGIAEEQDNAKLFIDWMCSTKGQNLYAESSSFRVPTNTQATAAEGLVTLDKVTTIQYDAVWAAGAKKEYAEKFETAIATAPKE